MGKNIIVTAGAAGFALVVGIAVGAAAHPSDPKIVTRPAVVKTETVHVPVTPKACLDALNYADRGFGLAGRGMKAASQAIDAVANFDLAGVRQATQDMNAVNRRLDVIGPAYIDAKNTCRNLGGRLS